MFGSIFWARWGLLVLLLALATVCALGRPGGGQSYRGSSSRSSGGGFSGGSHGGGGGGGDGLGSLIFLLIQNPVLGLIVLVIVIIVVIVAAANKKKAAGGWSTGGDTRWSGQGTIGDELSGGELETSPVPAGPASARRRLEALRQDDPDFSLVLFEDFLYSLYAGFHQARGRGELTRLSAYLAPGLADQFPRGQLLDVRDVIVGAMRFEDVRGLAGNSTVVRVTIVFESNFTEVAAGNALQGFYVEERWVLMRQRNVASRGPDKVKSFGCPGCGGPVDAIHGGSCSYCGRQVNTGGFDWVVESVQTLGREDRGPVLTADVAEEGTDLPTVRDPRVNDEMASLAARDSQFSWPLMEQRVRMIFNEFQTAWSGRDLSRMRPFLSDGLYQVQTYWVQEYLRQGLRNITENARVLSLEVARLTTDRYYDALTVRLFATSLDYTLNDAGKVVCGSRRRERRYSEYWTFVRGRGRSAAPRSDLNCPNCAAPLQINQVGVCEYCGAKVTSGQFDWVLSRIEQDDSYGG